MPNDNGESKSHPSDPKFSDSYRDNDGSAVADSTNVGRKRGRTDDVGSRNWHRISQSLLSSHDTRHLMLSVSSWTGSMIACNLSFDVD